MNPASTYRIQLHKDFTLKDLRAIIPYLHDLGVSTIYAAPILASTPGSMHGYDVIDPRIINPEIGTEAELVEIAAILKSLSMSWIQDIVPNHMAFSPLNPWVYDVMERGPASDYYNYFDIDWHHDRIKGKVIVPFLGGNPDECIARKELSLAVAENGFMVKAGDTVFPLSFSAYQIFNSFIPEEDKDLALDIEYWIGKASGATLQQWNDFKAGWSKKVMAVKHKKETLQRVVAAINRDTGKLLELLNSQYYILCHWKSTQKEINYRRFFTVNSLIGLRMEDDKVFDEYHRFIFGLYKKDLIQGLRLDHIDGLFDPDAYLAKLRRTVGESCFVIAEKILEEGEEMPGSWPLQGTSGYEFLSFTNQLLTRRSGARELVRFYKKLVPGTPDYASLVLGNKRLILEQHMAGEWNNLFALLNAMAPATIDRNRLRSALGCLMISFPVYRIYPDDFPFSEKELLVLEHAVGVAKKLAPELEAELDYLYQLAAMPDGEMKQHALFFFRRLMQFTGPLMAKGVEDTTFYSYNPLVSHDEVGDTPDHLGISVGEFHDKMKNRQKKSPLSLNATATHDTKRGEDVRVRLNVLSELQSEWQENVTRWLESDGNSKVGINDKYFIYQNIIGGFPHDFAVNSNFISRVQEYFVKAAREAKINTNWEAPDEEYEKVASEFIAAILASDSTFLKSGVSFVRKISAIAATYSLVQLLLKCTAPGIPDIYQGCELWDLSFVDPDNRRAVDYEERRTWLHQIKSLEKTGGHALFEFIRKNKAAGVEKLFLLYKILNYRKKFPLLFTEGEYLPLTLTPVNSQGVAFARKAGAQWMLVICPHNITTFQPGDDPQLIIPDDFPASWVNVLTGEKWTSEDLHFKTIFSRFPVAILANGHG